MQPEEPVDYEKPVAYDNEGRPLYAHPPAQSETHTETEPVMEVPAVPPVPPMPIVPSVSADDPSPTPDPMDVSEAKAMQERRHQTSMAMFPELTLSQEEYVISEVTRHSIGLVAPITIAIVLGLLIVAGLSFYSVLVPSGNPSFVSLLLPSLLLLLLIGLGTYIVIWVYKKNRFFVTNESIIQQVQLSIFAHDEKTVDLQEIKDISYAQTGALQLTLNYGSIKLTTEGENETYVFANVDEPKKVVTMLNSVLEDFKNDRPISHIPIVDAPTSSGLS